METVSKSLILRRAAVDGKQGETGKQGESAWTIRLTPQTLTFTADKNGSLGTSTSKTANVAVLYGSRVAAITKLTVDDATACEAGVEGTSTCIIAPNRTPLTYTNADGETVTIEGKYVPATAGQAVFTVEATDSIGDEATGETLVQKFTVLFTCNVATQYGTLVANDEQFSSELVKVSNTASDLTTQVSQIKQTADEIRLAVRESVDYHNYVPNSYLNLVFDDTTGYANNCLRRLYLPAGTFVLSMRGRALATGASLEARLYSSQWDSPTASLTIDDTNLTLHTVSTDAFTIETAGYYYLGLLAKGGAAHVLHLQIDAGTVAAAWTHSPDDLLPAQNIFPVNYEQGGTKNAIVAPSGASETVDMAVQTDDTGVLNIAYAEFLGRNLLAGETYTLSFYHKGAAVRLFLWGGDAETATVRGAASAISPAEASTNNQGIGTDPAADEWHRVAITFSLLPTPPTNLAFVIQTAENGTAYATGYRLERGGRVTESEAASTRDLLAAGVSIKSREIIATADNFRFQNNAGQTTATLDQDGNLTVPAVQTVDKTDADGNQTGHIIIRNGLLQVYGWSRKQIELGVDPDTGNAYMEYVNNDGRCIWRLDQDGMHTYDVTTGYFERINNIASPPTEWGEDRLSVLTATGGATYALSAAENAALIAAAAQPVTVYYRYHAPQKSKTDSTIVADPDNGAATAKDAENADGRIFSDTVVQDSNRVDGLIYYEVVPAIAIADGTYTYSWTVYKVTDGKDSYVYRWTYTTPAA